MTHDEILIGLTMLLTTGTARTKCNARITWVADNTEKVAEEFPGLGGQTIHYVGGEIDNFPMSHVVLLDAFEIWDHLIAAGYSRLTNTLYVSRLRH